MAPTQVRLPDPILPALSAVPWPACACKPAQWTSCHLLELPLMQSGHQQARGLPTPSAAACNHFCMGCRGSTSLARQPAAQEAQGQTVSLP